MHARLDCSLVETGIPFGDRGSQHLLHEGLGFAQDRDAARCGPLPLLIPQRPDKPACARGV
jgi:hypothetical protein